MKKLMAVSLAAVMSISLLATCGTKEKELADYVTLPDYQSGTMTAEAVEVLYSEEELLTDIETYLSYFSNLVEVDRAAEVGDVVNIDFTGYMNDELLENGSGTGYEVEIGSNTFFTEFEENLVGVVAGETYDLNLHFPEDYGVEELNGQPVLFVVTVNSVNESTPQELTDEFVYEQFGYDTVDEFMEGMRSNYQAYAESETLYNAQDAAFNAVYAASEIDSAPQEMIDEKVASYLENYVSYVTTNYGVTIDEYYELTGTSEEILKADILEQVTTELSEEMFIRAVARQEGLTVTEEEVNETAQMYIDYYSLTDTVESVIESYGYDQFEYSVFSQKVYETLVNYVQITYVSETTEE